MVLARARSTGDQVAVAELARIGAPPYGDTKTDAVKSQYSVAFTPAERLAFASLDPAVVAHMSSPPTGASYVPSDVVFQKDVRTVAMAAYDALRSEIVGFDADALGLEFGAPMFFLQGELDACTVTSEVQTYAARIRAPRKAFVMIEGGGHSPWMMRDQYLALLCSHVRPGVVPEE